MEYEASCALGGTNGRCLQAPLYLSDLVPLRLPVQVGNILSPMTSRTLILWLSFTSDSFWDSNAKNVTVISWIYILKSALRKCPPAILLQSSQRTQVVTFYLFCFQSQFVAASENTPSIV